MLQRVGIAQALINDPELVIFDEPMSGLDPLGRRDVRALILRLRDRGCTVFFSSHVLSDAEALCSRVAILAKGRLVADRAADATCSRSRRAAGSWSSPTSASRCRGTLDGRVPAGCAASARAATRSSCRSSRRPTASLAELTAAGAHARLAQSAPRDARGLLRRAGHGAAAQRATGARTPRRCRRESDRLRSRSTCFASRCATRCSTTSSSSRSC